MRYNPFTLILNVQVKRSNGPTWIFPFHRMWILVFQYERGTFKAPEHFRWNFPFITITHYKITINQLITMNHPEHFQWITLKISNESPGITQPLQAEHHAAPDQEVRRGPVDDAAELRRLGGGSSDQISGKSSGWFTLWLFNIAMENPTLNGGF